MLRPGHLVTTLAGVLIVLLPAPASSQQAIVGVVAELDTDERIEHAAVILVGADGTAHGAALSDSAGSFDISVPAAGQYSLRAHRVGYDPHSVAIRVPADARVEVHVNLRRDPMMLDAVTVTGEAPQSIPQRDFHRRQRLRQGYHFTRADFERLNASQVIHLLHWVPGYRPRGGAIVRDDRERSRSLALNFRDCPPVVYVDGYESRLGLLQVFGGISLSYVYGVEVFRNWSDVPGEFAMSRRGRSACGVIAIWTVAVER